ncbi:MAG: tRNA preQ1(34) S-adenosylmethionine ribosyltransferase-isomerase QueA [Proteobacteria bacterium]|nr:tRNA preQ1(34) S-adenosylmethionine ribosyltransferase-isomerase QueA [Pseudomonadota bacterium]MDA1326059.1 tRNA preQ1(34) S-adenosylmethionine ribosyltransferase-isomerase QueA [Pseudomonadota bacterium]
MRTDAFDFDLPRALIAQQPASPRDSSRLLTVAAELCDLGMRDLPRLLRAGDILVLNDTRVIPARLRGKRGEATIEVTLHRRLSEADWHAFARPARRLHLGDRIVFAPDFSAMVTEKLEGGEIGLRFDDIPPEKPLELALERHGFMPLPPYIGRPKEGAATDRETYQTVYAANPGAVAAPTAGLHFTETLLSDLQEAGIAIAKLTLHVGAGTFLPVKVDRIEDHKMHSEWGRIDGATADRINEARAAGGRIVAAGTTALRLLESATDEAGIVRGFEDTTDIFISPGYRFRAVDMLLTNFHLPKSTLFMLVSAFAGLARMKAAYRHAIKTGYRFYSYGDACLLHRDENVKRQS